MAGEAVRTVRPQPGPQTTFLASAADIAIYGGAAGGGKTWALLMEPVRHINNPNFGAVFFRRTTVQIRNEGGLWDESQKVYPLLSGAPREHILDWKFPSGATVTFTHLEHDKTRLNWQGAQIPLICFDELTHFSPSQFWYMVSRNRSTCGVRPYIRATCNPDVDSWVADFIAWWIDPDTGLAIMERAGVLRWFVRINDRLIWADSRDELAGHLDSNGEPIPPKSVTFIPAKLTDNLALMAADPGYLANLMALPTVERERLLGGNWKIKNTQALVFTNWRVVAFKTPTDAISRFGADWGFAMDPTVLLKGFIGRWDEGRAVADDKGKCLFLDYEAAGIGIEIDDTPALFAGDCPPDRKGRDGRPAWENPNRHSGVPGALKWTIRADSARPETVSYMQRKGFKIIPAIKGPGSIEDGVTFLQSFEIVIHPRCVLAAKEFGSYSWKVDLKTGEVLSVLEDKDNNAIDAARYALEGLRRAAKPSKPDPARNPTDRWSKRREPADGWRTT